MPKIIARHQENITLNPYEFIVDEKGNVKKFENDDEAVSFLNENSNVIQDKEAWDEEGIYIVEYSDYFEEDTSQLERLN